MEEGLGSDDGACEGGCCCPQPFITLPAASRPLPTSYSEPVTQCLAFLLDLRHPAERGGLFLQLTLSGTLSDILQLLFPVLEQHTLLSSLPPQSFFLSPVHLPLPGPAGEDGNGTDGRGGPHTTADRLSC